MALIAPEAPLIYCTEDQARPMRVGHQRSWTEVDQVHCSTGKESEIGNKRRD